LVVEYYAVIKNTVTLEYPPLDSGD
jgi:hypothetical protein